MKRKSLLLLVPFAVAAMAGCTPVEKKDGQCDSATVQLNKTSLTLEKDETYQLTATISVENCPITWSTDNEAVATVDQNGLVTAHAEGTANIGVNGSAFCEVKVEADTPTPPPPVVDELTPQEVIELCDNAGQGNVVDHEVIVVGVAVNSTFDSEHKQWKGEFDGSSLVFNSAYTEESYDTLNGKTIKIKGYPELYEGVYKIGYLPASVSPTGAKYNPTLVNVDEPVHPEVSEIVSVASSPASVYVGAKVSPSSIKLNVKYTDGSTGVLPATTVEVDTSVAKPSVEGKAWLNDLGPVTFNIEVKAAPVADELTPAQVIALCDEAGSGVVVDHEVIVVGVANDSAFNSQYKQWSGKFEGSKLTFDSAATNETYDTLNGKTIKVKGYPELYNGTYKIGYLPANISPTGAKYNPTLVSVEESTKTVVGIEEVLSHPDSVYVGAKVDASKVSLKIKYDDNTFGTVNAESVDCDTSAENQTATATAHYKTFTKTFTIAVIAKPVPTGEITVDEEYSLTMASLKLGKEYSSNDEGEIGWVDLYGQTDPVDSIQGNKREVSATKPALNSEIYNILPFSKEIKTVEFACAKDPRDNKMSIFFGSTDKPSGNEVKLGKDSEHTFAANQTTIVEAPAGCKYFDIKWVEFSSVFSSIKFTFEGEPAKELKSLSVKTQPTTVDYKEGQSFSDAGLVLLATYDDDKTEDITSGWTISPAGALATTDNKVTVSYGGKSVEIAITVSARVLNSIEVTTQPTKTTYVEGESFDPAGMVVVANYEGESPETITGYTYSPNGALTLSDSEVTISFNGKTDTVAITVEEAPEVLATKFTFTAKDKVEETGSTNATVSGNASGYEDDRGAQWANSIEVGTITISDFPTDVIIKKITVDTSCNDKGGEMSVKVGENAFGTTVENPSSAKHVSNEFAGSASGSTISISFTKGGKSTYIKFIEIEWEKAGPVEPAVNKVTVSPSTAKLDLTETKSTTLVATVDAVGGADESVTWSVSPEGIVEVENGVVTAKAEGSATVTATSVFDGTKSASCEVEVLGQPAPEPVLTEIYINGDMTNKTYNLGDSWSSAGLQVKAKWTEGKEDTVLDASEYDLAFNPTAPAAETTQVVVTATLKADGTKTATKTVTDITVNEKANSVKTAYDAAMALEDGGVTTSEYTFEGVVTATQGSSFVVYDRDYAILVYNKSVSGLEVGKTVKVVSTMQNYGGLAETKTVSSATLTGTGTVPEAVSITSVAQLSEYKTNILVDCAQIEVVSKQSGWSGSNSNNWTVKINGESVTLSLNKYTYDATKASTLSALDVGDKFTARNLIIGSFKGTRQLSSTGESTFSKFVPEVTAVSVTGDFTKKSYNLGNDWDIGGLVFKGTTADGEITLNSSDFDFEFNPEKASDTKINSVEVTATYKAKPTLSCTTTITGISVNDAPAVEPYDVTFQKNTSASSYTSTYNQTLDDIEWVLNGNGAIDNYVKLSSGTANTTADRYICSQTAFDNEASQIIFKTGALDSAATVNSVTLTVHSSAEDAKSGSNATESVSGTWVTSGEMSFSKPTGSSWSGKYFRLTLNLSNTTRNKGVIITGVKVVF